MAKFKFKYQKVLEIRIKEEDQKKKVLAEKIADLERIKLELLKLKEDRLKYETKILLEMQEGVKANRMASYNKSKKWYRDEIDNFEYMKNTAEDAIKKARNDLVDASQEVKKVEKLKENAYKKYLFNEKKELNEMIEEAINFKMVEGRNKE